jgi:glycosyltransferase involved in cell wall biosynthesis
LLKEVRPNPSPIRICLVIHSLKGGGMERVMSLLANNFSKKKNTEIHLVLTGIHRDIDYPLNDSVVVHRPSFTFKNSRRSLDTLRTMWFIRTTIKMIDPDTILSFGEMWNNLVLLSLGGLSYPVYISDRSQPDKDLGRLQNFLRRKLYPSAAGFIAQTGHAADVCRRKNWNSNIAVIGNPVRTISNEGGIEKENLVLFVGRFIPTKHVDRLIRIFAAIDAPGWRLEIVGWDANYLTLSKDYQKLIKELDAENKISLEGERKDVDRYFNRAKIFAYTSSSEGFPNVIGEALSAGLPVVTYDCIAGPADMIRAGENGFLIPQFDDETFREKLNLLMGNKQLCTRMGETGRITIREYDVEGIVDRFFKFITQDIATGTRK